MTIGNTLLLLAAAVLAGALNSVAGGGSFLSFPALMKIGGVPAVSANATNTVALWPGSLASVGAYRQELTTHRGTVVGLAGVSLAGGVLGAILLLKTPEVTFLRLLPWLLLSATLLFAFGGNLTALLRDRQSASGTGRAARIGASALQLAISTYGGYFGGGIVMLMLAMLSVMGMEDIHAMNAVKAVLSACINGVAVVTFIAAGAVVWPHALLMTTGAIAGGYGGARCARRLAPRYARAFVMAVGFAMTAYFFIGQR